MCEADSKERLPGSPKSGCCGEVAGAAGQSQNDLDAIVHAEGGRSRDVR